MKIYANVPAGLKLNEGGIYRINYKMGVAESVIKKANETPEGKKKFPTVPGR
jgi:hypothetical protein